MVYNQPSYDIMVVMKEQEGRLDTLDFCNSLGITREQFDKRMANHQGPFQESGLFQIYAAALYEPAV